MEITVDVRKTIAEIEQEKLEYEHDLRDTLSLFRRKLVDYHTYIGNLSNAVEIKKVDNPPPVPVDNTKEFEKSIKMLNAHTQATLTMTDEEYESIITQVKQYKGWNDTATMSLNSLRY